MSNDQTLENYMRKNYYIETNFSGIKVGDYLYILENGKPQKIKCFNVAEYSVAKQGYGAGVDKYKKLSFVRVSNDNKTIINDKGEKLAEFNDKNEIITDIKYTCDYTIWGLSTPTKISGKKLFLNPCDNDNNKKFYSQKISITISSGFLQGKKTYSEPENIVFWKKKLLSTITGATSASTFNSTTPSTSTFGGKKTKTKRRRQIRRKTKKQRKTRHK